jgi:hypothetical protein
MPDELSAAERAAIEEAVRIVREDRTDAYLRARLETLTTPPARRAPAREPGPTPAPTPPATPSSGPRRRHFPPRPPRVAAADGPGPVQTPPPGPAPTPPSADPGGKPPPAKAPDAPAATRRRRAKWWGDALADTDSVPAATPAEPSPPDTKADTPP